MGNIVEWKSAAIPAKYPFLESNTLTSKDRGWIVPTSAFVDAQIRVPNGADLVQITSLTRVGDTITGTISSTAGEIGSFDMLLNPSNVVCDVFDRFGVNVGIVLVGSDQSELIDMPNGTSTFKDSLVFESSCIFEYPKSVLTGFIVDGTLRPSGKVMLYAGPGIELETLSSTIIRVNAIGQLNAVDNCGRNPDWEPIRVINSIGPDINGDFRIEADTYSAPLGPEDQRQVLKITPGTNQITFSLAK